MSTNRDDKKRARYLHIYEQMRRDITAGVYRRGSKLPSKRDMADACGVSVITIEHAYELLADEGYIQPREKSGYFVIYDEAEVFPVKEASGHAGRDSARRESADWAEDMAIRKLGSTLAEELARIEAKDESRAEDIPHVVRKERAYTSDDLWSGLNLAEEIARREGGRPTESEHPSENTQSASKQDDRRGSQKRDNEVTKFAGQLLKTNPADSGEGLSYATYAKITRRVIAVYGESVTQRSPGFGTQYLREAIASYLQRSRHLDATADRIVIGSGAEYLYSMLVKVLGRELVYGIESPSYEKIAQVYGTEGVKLAQLGLGADGIDSKALWGSEAQILHITPYRSFPSGVTASASKKHEYIRWSRERGAIIIEDDAESEFSPSRKPEETVCALAGGHGVIYLNTFTRTVGPFLRVAYMVVPEELIEVMKERIGFYACTVPTLEQYVIAELIAGGDFERHINRVRRRKRG